MTQAHHQLMDNFILYIFCVFATFVSIAMIVIAPLGGFETFEAIVFAESLALLCLLGVGLIVFNVDDVQNRASNRCLSILAVAAIPVFLFGAAATVAGGGAIR